MTYVGNVGASSSFKRKKYDVFYWKINEFSKLTDKHDHFYGIPNYFYFKGRQWDLVFYPNGKSGESAGFFGLYFRLRDCKETSCVRLTLGLMNQSGRNENYFSQNVILSETKHFGAPALIRRSEFFKRKEELAPSDCLTFAVFLGLDTLEPIIRDIADEAETGDEEGKNEEEKSEKKGGEKVLGDMAKLLASGDQSDATIVVGEVEYKVHSCILAARTPVFAALFEHDTIEKATRKVNIMDCEPAIFRECLNFIYTGSVQDLTAENSLGLYRVADKYLIEGLKEVCRQCILDHLSSKTFCGAVQLALKCGDKDLLGSAFDYFAENFRLIIRSVEWQTYIEEKPREANDILIGSLGPP